MPNKDDLLNLNNKKNLKKPLIYGAIAFLIFIIAILGFAIYDNTSSKQESVVLPPQIQEEKQETMFKEVPIEETNTTNKNLADQLIQKEQKNNPPKNNNEINTEVKQEKKQKQQVVKTENKTQKKETKPAVKKHKTAAKNYYVQVAALVKYKKPNKKFLNLIKKEGYNYRLYDTYYVKNSKKIEVVKILIGPFDKNTAKKELVKIKKTITQNAFIYKVK